jgi:sugar phosphate isomerase/epimerase
MYTRRNFLRTVALGGAALCGAGALKACSSITQRQLGNIGYITGILGRNLGDRDWKSILTQTAQMGYTEIETGNYLGDSAASFLAFCREIGLKPVAGGIGGFTDDRDKINESLDKLNALEIQFAISYWPWFGGAPFDLEHCKRSVDVLNLTGEMCKSRGLVFCWHNHDHEFVPMEEGLPFDYLMDYADPELVKCELDIYWTQKGGADPVQTLQKYSGRFPILHVKDMAPGEEQDFACPGKGIIDWPAVFNESLDQGIKHYFVERDNEVDGLGCLSGSAEYLKNLRF